MSGIFIDYERRFSTRGGHYYYVHSDDLKKLDPQKAQNKELRLKFEQILSCAFDVNLSAGWVYVAENNFDKFCELLNAISIS